MLQGGSIEVWSMILRTDISSSKTKTKGLDFFEYLHRKHTSWVQDPYAATTEWPAWLEFWLKSWLAGLLFGCFGWWQRIASQGQGAWLTFLLLMQKSFLLCHKTWPLLLFKHYFCLIWVQHRFSHKIKQILDESSSQAPPEIAEFAEILKTKYWQKTFLLLMQKSCLVTKKHDLCYLSGKRNQITISIWFNWKI